MDFVYMCRPGDNEELRYSIRSVIKNAEMVNDIWVIGDKPDWYTGKFIKVNPIGSAYENVRNNLRHVIANPNISEDFVLMNDDFFILRKLNSVSHYYGGLLANRYMRHQELAGPNHYANLLRKTDTVLKQQGIKEPLNYELHVPMQFNKAKLSETIDKPFKIRSYYGNKYGIGGEEIEDVKIYSHVRFVDSSAELDNGTPFISTDDGSFVSMRFYIEQLFPDKSKYELD
jgi:hypothetical protein